MLARKKKVTLSDVAGAVGVSRALVGKVLGGGNSNIRVSEETARMIREAAERLHYQPNLSARMLTGQSSHLIGILIDAQPPPVTFRTLAFIDKYAAANGYRLLIGEAHNSIDSLYHHYSNFMQYNVDGVICLAHDYPGQEEKLQELFRDAENIVFVEKPVLPNACCVEIDRAAAVEELTSLLLRTRKRIGIIMEDPSYHSIRQRKEGYCRAMRKAGLEKLWIHFLPDEQVGLEELMHRAITEFVLPEQLEALIAPNDLAASYLMRELMRRGLRIPDDIAVAGFDNEPFSGSLYPSLTTIDDNNEEIGKYAFDLLLEQLNEKKTSVHHKHSVCVVPRIVWRESI